MTTVVDGASALTLEQYRAKERRRYEAQRRWHHEIAPGADCMGRCGDEWDRTGVKP